MKLTLPKVGQYWYHTLDNTIKICDNVGNISNAIEYSTYPYLENTGIFVKEYFYTMLFKNNIKLIK